MSKHKGSCGCGSPSGSHEKDEPKKSHECACEHEKAHEKTHETITDATSFQDKYLRAAADFENTKKRLEREKREVVEFASERVIRELLPVVDSFEHALKALKDSDGNSAAVSGIGLILEQLMSVLKKEGVSRIECIGKSFDHRYYEAVGQVESEEALDDTVLEEVQAGYSLNGRVIRLALVKVAKNNVQTTDDRPRTTESKEELS